jgi:hypothetical protein
VTSWTAYLAMSWEKRNLSTWGHIWQTRLGNWDFSSLFCNKSMENPPSLLDPWQHTDIGRYLPKNFDLSPQSLSKWYVWELNDPFPQRLGKWWRSWSCDLLIWFSAFRWNMAVGTLTRIRLLFQTRYERAQATHEYL